MNRTRSKRSRRLAFQLRILVVACLLIWLILVHTGALGSWFGIEVGRILGTAVAVLHALFWLAVIWVFANARRKRAWLALGSLVGAMVFGELAIRFLHPAGDEHTFHLVYDPQFHHANPSSTRMLFESFGLNSEYRESGPVYASTNSIGLRSGFEREEFLGLDHRVVVLGDSFAFGLYVDDGEPAADLLQDSLGRRLGSQSLGVLNAGVTSYSPLLQRIQFRHRLAEWKPNLVVLLLDATDVGDDYRYQEQIDGARRASYGGGEAEPDASIRFPRNGFLRLLERDGSWARHSALIQRLYFPYLMIKGGLLHPWLLATSDPRPFAMELEIDGNVEQSPFFIYRYPLSRTLPFFEATARHVADIAQASRELGAEFLLVVCPRYHHWDPEAVPDNWEKAFYSVNEPYQYEWFRFWEERRDTLGYPMINLLDTFRSAPADEALVFRDDPHWTAAGHRLVAEALTGEIVERGLLAHRESMTRTAAEP